MKNIVVAADLSPVTQAVVRTAGRLAKGLDAALWLVHVAAPEPPFVGYDVGPQSVREQVAAQIRSTHRQLQEIEKNLQDQGVRATALLVQGPIVEKIQEEVARLEADLLVIGSHGHGALYHLVLGSVSNALVAGATCPVVVVPSAFSHQRSAASVWL